MDRYVIKNNYSILKGCQIYYIYDNLYQNVISDTYETEKEAEKILGELKNERLN